MSLEETGEGRPNGRKSLETWVFDFVCSDSDHSNAGLSERFDEVCGPLVESTSHWRGPSPIKFPAVDSVRPLLTMDREENCG